MPASGPAGYAPAGMYPTAAYPAAMQVPAPPKKKGRAATIVFAILMVVFLLAAVGSTVLYVGKNNDLTAANKAKVASDTANQSKLTALQQQLASTQAAAAAAAQTAQGQIADLNAKLKTDVACVKDAEIVLNLNTSSQATVQKDLSAMIKACDAADFNS